LVENPWVEVLKRYGTLPPWLLDVPAEDVDDDGGTCT
jgi:hypothetical protein